MDPHALPSTRIYRLAVFGILVVLLLYLVINTGLAWGYIYFLTHPFCRNEPQPIQDAPTVQQHTLRTTDGLNLQAWYYPSQNGAAILLMDGPCGSLGYNGPASFLVQQGYGVLQIDSRANAQPPSTVTLGAEEVLDAEAGLEFLQSQPQMGHIGAYGFSMGGVTVIRTAARHSEITSVIAEGGFFNMGDDFVERGAPKSLPAAVFLYTVAGAYWLQTGVNPWAVSPVDDLPRISPRPVLLIYGEHEVKFGRPHLQYEAAREPKELWIVPGGSHGTNYSVTPEEYERRVLKFFEETLIAP